jgi:hypothetical protein
LVHFNRLLELAEAGAVKAVIVQHPDRLGRGHILELAGEYVQFGRKKQKGVKKQVSPEPVILPCPAIVSRELFDEAHARLAVGRQRSQRNNKHCFYLVRCMIRCTCRTTMTGSDRGRYYRCNAALRPHDFVTVCNHKTFYHLAAAGAGARLVDPRRLDRAGWRPSGSGTSWAIPCRKALTATSTARGAYARGSRLCRRSGHPGRKPTHPARAAPLRR